MLRPTTARRTGIVLATILVAYISWNSLALHWISQVWFHPFRG